MSAAGDQPVRFVLVGAGGCTVNVGAFAVFFRIGSPYVVAALGAYLLANALMYVGNRYFTFRLGSAGFWRGYPRYLFAGVLVALLNAGLLASIVEGAGVDPRAGQVLSLVALTPVAFVLIRTWTFRLGKA